MKTLIQKGSLVLLVAAFAAAVPGSAQGNSPVCNNWLITGVYGFTIEGTKLSGPGPTGSQVGVAITDFKGDGTLVQIDAVSIGGIQVSDFSHTPATGTYTVNPDCTGTFTVNFTDGRPTVKTWFVVVDNGSEIDTMVVGVPLVPPPGVQGPGVIATRSIGKRRFTPIF